MSNITPEKVNKQKIVYEPLPPAEKEQIAILRTLVEIANRLGRRSTETELPVIV